MKIEQRIRKWGRHIRNVAFLTFFLIATSTRSQTVDSFNPNSGDLVFTMAIQVDGKIFAGGAFTTLGGQTRNKIGRLNADGTLDTAFNSGTTPFLNSPVLSIIVQADGKILVGGTFTNLSGQSCNYMGRLNADGTLDNIFNPEANSTIQSLIPQPDGKILVAGPFSSLGGQSRLGIGRLNVDGTLDDAFNAAVGGGSINSLALQPDGKILVGGVFLTLNGQARTNIGRLNADGTLDSNFNPGANDRVRALVVQPDGKILAGGSFTNLGNHARNFIGRLNEDGTIDAAFNPGADNAVYSLTMQTDGKILLGGNFITLAGGTCSRIGRLTADGALDNSFNTGANNTVRSLAIQCDGRILAGGDFTTLGGQTRNRMGRLTATEPSTESLTFDGSSIIWLRNGTSPEVARATFEASTNGGNTWFEIGVGSRVPNGWQVTNVFLPSFSAIRARGLVYGGYGNGSSWFAETIIGVPLIYIQPTNRTNTVATTANFTVVAAGSTPLNYQWQKNGTNLSDGGNISGAQSSVLTMSNVFGTDMANYSVVISNSYGSVTSQIATLTVNEPLISGQPTNQIVVPGENATFNVVTVGTPAINYQWRKDGTNISDASESSLILTNVQLADEGNYNVIVSNSFGSVTSAVAVLTVNSANPDFFNPGISTAYDPFLLSVNSMAIQTDGKIVTGGNFTTLGGQTRWHIGRLKMDGTLDTNFNPGVFSPSGSRVYSLVIQPEGKILVGGFFSALGGQPRSNIGRLNSDGTLDSSFNSQNNGQVYSLAIQPDGKILVGGRFTSLGGQTRTNIGRLNVDGTLDFAFNPGVNYDLLSYVNSILVQADGKILVGGSFTNLAGQARNRIGRLNADGSLDINFNPGASGPVETLSVQPDGKILVGGAFTNLGGQARNRIGQLNADGSLDTTFDPGANGANGFVNSFALQSDGKILVSGEFSTLAGQSRSRIARLNADGTLDIAFNPGANGEVRSLALQNDGKVLVGGKFSTLGGQIRNGIGRLNATEPANQSLTVEQGAATWLRSGTSPEFSQTTFEAFVSNANWVVFPGTPIPGGWQLTNGFLTSSSTVRARGFVSGGYGNASSWFVEAGIGFPSIQGQPVSRTNNAATTANFNVLVLGTMLEYQWYKDGISLSENNDVSGTQTASLTLANVFGADAGDYFVIVSNNYGSVTSSVATFSVIDPAIAVQPVNQLINVGQTATLNATATGTSILNYQWRKNGTNITQAFATSLLLTNANKSDAGNYDVIVTNAFGSVTSMVAVVNVNLADADSFNPECDNGVYSLAVQTDGKILAAGSFTTMAGQTRNHIARLNLDGTLDTAFDLGANDDVYSLVVRPDGKILVGGIFTALGGQPRERIGQFNSDGTLDPTFNPGANNDVYSLVLQADGKVLVGGSFINLGGRPRYYLGRLNEDGTTDTNFYAGANGGNVYSLAVQLDGKILAAGGFLTLDWQETPLKLFGRLNENGTLDATFNPNADGGYVYCLAIQADGKILVGGQFSKLGGQTRNRIGRLNANGTLDTTFNPTVNNGIRSFGIQADRKILLAGPFTTLEGQPRNGIGRLNQDGTLDVTFNPTPNGSVHSLAIQNDGKILIGGTFTTLAGQIRNRLGRLNATELATENLTFDGSVITWLRGGSSPEVLRTTFDASTNGATWTSLGIGTRIQGGWQLTNIFLPPLATIRARGIALGGYFNASSWFVESTWSTPQPLFVVGDGRFGFLSNSFGFNINGSVGQTIILEGSTNFSNWIPLATNSLGTAPFNFSDPESTNFPRRFYRTRTP